MRYRWGAVRKNLYRLTPFWPLTSRELQIGGLQQLRVLPVAQFQELARLARGEFAPPSFPVTFMQSGHAGGRSGTDVENAALTFVPQKF
jgi:hypothetical protein